MTGPGERYESGDRLYEGADAALQHSAAAYEDMGPYEAALTCAAHGGKSSLLITRHCRDARA